MTIHKITSVYFSPTGSTENVLSLITDKMPQPLEKIDLTSHAEHEKAHTFAGDEAVIFGIPVYGGRVPAPAVEALKQIKGEQTPAILVAVYGNRAYEDALLELKTIVEQHGFVTVGAAAFIAEHSIMHSVATGRPDEADKKIIADFAAKMWEKLSAAPDVAALPAVSVKGNIPYRPYGGVPLKPHADKNCTQCGICAESCPVKAISPAEPNKTDDNLCISCMRCMKVCPSHARKLNSLALSLAEHSFAKKNSIRQEPELFL